MEIEGAIHAMELLWQQKFHEEEGGFLLIDTMDVSNEENWNVMLWAVHYEWTSGAKFTFNCYCHGATRVIWYARGLGHFIHSKEGVTQSDPLSSIVYGIGIMPLIHDLRKAHPKVIQRWYVNDSGAGAGGGWSHKILAGGFIGARAGPQVFPQTNQ